MVKSSVANSGVGLLGFCPVMLLPLLMASVNLQLSLLTLQIMPAIQWPFFVHFVMSKVILEFQSIREYS